MNKVSTADNNEDVEEPPKKKGRKKENYGRFQFFLSQICLETTHMPLCCKKYIPGVDNRKYYKEKKDPKAVEAILKVNTETDFAIREEIYEKYREALNHQIRWVVCVWTIWNRPSFDLQDLQ